MGPKLRMDEEQGRRLAGSIYVTILLTFYNFSDVCIRVTEHKYGHLLSQIPGNRIRTNALSYTIVILCISAWCLAVCLHRGITMYSYSNV